MRSPLLLTLLLVVSLHTHGQEQQKMAHLNADLVVSAFPDWIEALKEAAANDIQQQQLLMECMAEFEKAKNEFSAMDFSQYTEAQKDSLFKQKVFSKGQQCDIIRGGLLQNSTQNVPEAVKLYQQVMDKVLAHFKAKDGYDNIYSMGTADIAKPEIQESIKYYKSKDITEAFIKVMKEHVAKSESLKVAAASEVER